MTVSQIIKELNHLQNFLYIYWEPSDSEDYMIILGGHSTQLKDDHTGIIPAMRCNLEMQKIFEKETLEESDKFELVRLMKRIHNFCDYRDSKMESLSQQEEYLNRLSEEQLEEISKQIEMHKFARSLYRDYH